MTTSENSAQSPPTTFLNGLATLNLGIAVVIALVMYPLISIPGFSGNIDEGLGKTMLVFPILSSFWQ